MKGIIATSIVAIVAASTASADVVDRIKVYDHTKMVTSNKPVIETQCYNVEVPIYGTGSQGASGGDVLAGMSIGGLLGKGVTGKDDGAAAGAVFGGIIAADQANKKQIVGYQIQQQCKDTTVYHYIEQEVYSHSTIRFYLNGVRYVVPFQRSMEDD